MARRGVRGGRISWRIALDSGQDVSAVSDQRDWAAVEGAELSGRPISILRYLAWSAAHRTGAYAGTWEQFGKDCVEVEDVTDYPDPPAEQDGEGEQSLDPGRPGPPAGT